MSKVFLTCFAAFKSLYSDELAVGLFSSLAKELQCLQKSLEEKPPSLGWCSDALLVIKKIHSHFLLYFERSDIPTSWEGVTMLDEYMRATLDLLDLCNLLKSSLSGLERYRTLVDFNVKRLEGNTFSDLMSKIELERPVRVSYNNLFDVKKWREMKLNKGEVSKVKLKTRSTNMHVLQAIGNTMSLISLLIFCSILHPFPIKINEELCNGVANLGPFSESIKKLIGSFGERFRSMQDIGGSILYENEMIEDAFGAFKAQVISISEMGIDDEKLTHSVEMLKKRSLALKEGLDLFECGINELFEDVIKGRKKVIELIITNNDTTLQNY